ncbi:hypothetical protein B9N43_00520 [Denitratisoma sp. DHT3]|uniref:hypothetical protein n=1 Tax=Denitratisoma sp. DHT3 TaxID=1981880 RepID=UPI0011986ABF|nr:hypothetical protein [Denitratisoma sp. DHT3]QDX79879.1 hypothetical protein B9N43_00520 [Denitratisoma sp. DHT3]
MGVAMTRFLFAWELGANYGHLARDIPVAIKLRNKGHQVLFAVRDTKAAAELLGRQCFPYVQAPFCITPPRLARPPANYAELLVAEGWGSPLTLLGMVKG